MKYIDDFLNKITMYKLVLYGLLVLVGVSLVLSLLNFVSFSFLSITSSLVVLFVTCYLINLLLAKIFKVQTNTESYFISAVILTFLLDPITSVGSLWQYLLIGAIAMASKYILAISKKHIFNPSAISLVVASILGIGLGSWWVGSEAMLIPTAILGFLILRKVKRFELFFAFLASAVVSMSIVSLKQGFDLLETLNFAFLSGPLIFFGTVMLTEPFTTPPKNKDRLIYGIIVGIIYGLDFHFGRVFNSPALALVLGNIYSYIVSPKDKLVLKLVSKKAINEAGDVDEFIFEPNKRLNFKAGQYLEWTLGHKKVDIRGNRRYFTISSSPTEKDMRLGIKFYDMVSSFKQNLGEMKQGDEIFAGNLAGEFTLPSDKKKKLVWIAGGIGITPFRSMAKYLTDMNERRDIVLFSSQKTRDDIVYKDIFDEAERVSGTKTIYVINNLMGETLSNMRSGFVNEEMIKKEIPDYKDRMFYISGPRSMIVTFENTLSKMGISRNQIKTDFFPGFV